jgi:hypothetical protein
MNHCSFVASLTLSAWLCIASAQTFAAEPPEPKFTAVTLDDHIQIGYGLAIADVDGDGKPDILLADKKQFVWYRNPGPEKARDPGAWKKYLLAENLTVDDNVCIAAQDIDGDGKCEIAVGAAWKPSDTEKSGAVFYLIQPADRTQPWTPVKFPEVEPTTHRMRWLQIKDRGWGLLVLPLHGRGNKDGAGNPVKIIWYQPPAPLNDPAGQWKPVVYFDQTLHMTHNFEILDPVWGHFQVIVAGKEATPDLGLAPGGSVAIGWNVISPAAGVKNDSGKAIEPTAGFNGAGEIRVGTLADGKVFRTTVEPMHGTDLCVYRTPAQRIVLTNKLVEGHALACGRMIPGLPGEQIVVGWRGKAGTADTPIGVSVWTCLDPRAEKWRETVVDPNGMACEDLKLADLDGSGKPAIVASGRRTHNVKIYFNDTAPEKP